VLSSAGLFPALLAEDLHLAVGVVDVDGDLVQLID
jgi:hypothetical protein